MSEIRINGATGERDVVVGPEEVEERVRRMHQGLQELAGIGKDGRGTDAIMRELRGDWEP